MWRAGDHKHRSAGNKATTRAPHTRAPKKAPAATRTWNFTNFTAALGAVVADRARGDTRAEVVVCRLRLCRHRGGAWSEESAAWRIVTHRWGHSQFPRGRCNEFAECIFWLRSFRLTTALRGARIMQAPPHGEPEVPLHDKKRPRRLDAADDSQALSTAAAVAMAPPGEHQLAATRLSCEAEGSARTAERVAGAYGAALHHPRIRDPMTLTHLLPRRRAHQRRPSASS